MLFLIIPLLILVVAFSYFFILKKKKETEKKETREKKNQNEKIEKSQKQEKEKEKEQHKQHNQHQSTKALKPMETAEKHLCVGNTTAPICLSFEPTGKYLIVCCKNRQQVLFEVSGIENNAPGKQRYRLTNDSVIDCSLFINQNNNVEVALALDRGKSIESYELVVNSNKFNKGFINIENAGKLTVDKIKVAPDLSFVAALGDETYVRVFHPNGGLLFAKDTSQMHNTEISVSSNSELVAASSYTSEIVVYGVDRDRTDVPIKVSKAFTFSEHKNSIQSIDFDRKTMMIASGGKDCKYNLILAPLRWREGDIARPQWSGTLPEPILIVRLNPIKQLIACLTESGKLYFCDSQGIKKTVEVAHNCSATIMEWEPNGKWVVVASLASPFIYAYECP